jgi:hypothetical protein
MVVNAMFVALMIHVFPTPAVTVKVVVVLVAAEATGAKPIARNPNRATDKADLTVYECIIEMTPGN